MKAIILVIEILEAKQDAGTITFEEAEMLCRWIEKAEQEIYKNK